MCGNVELDGKVHIIGVSHSFSSLLDENKSAIATAALFLWRYRVDLDLYILYNFTIKKIFTIIELHYTALLKL